MTTDQEEQMFDVSPDETPVAHHGSIRTSPETDKLFAALAKAQGDIATPKRDKVVNTGQYSYSYADLAAIKDVCRKPLKDNGLAVVQSATARNYTVEITTLVTHSSGQWLEVGPLSVEVGSTGKNMAQATGSVITYMKRYALSAALNIATDDDDDAQSDDASKSKRKGTKKKADTRGINKKSEVSEAQKKMLFAKSMDKAKELGIKQKKIVDDLLVILGYDSTSQITKEDVDKCKRFIENYGKGGATSTSADEPDIPAEQTDDAGPDEIGGEEPPF